MKLSFADRMTRPDFQGEFTTKILEAAADPNIISFAGGLPNPISFPVKEMEEAVKKVLERDGVAALQYSTTNGYYPLRRFIAERYANMGVTDVRAEDIIITNGSQQVLDMCGAILLNDGDEILAEDPTYLAALQSFHLYHPTVLTVPLKEDGLDCDALEELLKTHHPKLFYAVTTYQNPTGRTYSPAVRKRLAEILSRYDILMIEDNPYYELNFTGVKPVSMGAYLGAQCCLMGTFSKIVAPGMRIGWVAARDPEVYASLLRYKGTADLHTNIFGQMVLSQYLEDNDLDAHIAKACALYKHKSEWMSECLRRELPESCSFVEPEGGMFLWVTLPEGVSGVDIFYDTIAQGVAVCPGDPFFEHRRGTNTVRLNFSNASDENIEKGIRVFANAIRKRMS